jgi:hypothetical protein
MTVHTTQASTITQPARADLAVLRARVGTRLAGVLTEQAEQLPHDVQSRLRFAREQALQRARRAGAVAGAAWAMPQGYALATAGMGPHMTQRPPLWLRTAGLLPVLVLVVGLIAIMSYRDRERVATAAAIDAELLADDLPPAAWSDPGFAEFLGSPPS